MQWNDELKQETSRFFHLVLIICIIIVIITRPTDCTSKPLYNEFVPPKNSHPFMSSEKKHTKMWKWMNEKIKQFFDNALPHSATLSNSISVFVWFALHTEVKLSIVLMDGVCIRPRLQAQSRKTFKTLFLFHTKWIVCRNFSSRLFFYLFTISPTLFSNSDCCLYSRQRGILKIK